MGISANGAMLPPALASSVIAHAGTFRDRPSWHGPRSPMLAPRSPVVARSTIVHAGTVRDRPSGTVHDRAVAAGDLRYDTPAAAADGLEIKDNDPPRPRRRRSPGRPIRIRLDHLRSRRGALLRPMYRRSTD
jgi:hypothetical protein